MKDKTRNQKREGVMKAILGRLLEIQIDQNKILKELLEQEEMQRRMELNRRYELNQERLKQLYKQLFAEVF